METQQLVMAAIANWYKKSDAPVEQSQKLSKIVDIAHDLKVSISNNVILYTLVSVHTVADTLYYTICTVMRTRACTHTHTHLLYLGLILTRVLPFSA